YKNSDDIDTIREQRNEKANSIYSNIDNDPRGLWTSVSYVNPARKEDRPNLYYPLFNPITKKEIWHPTNAWKYSKETYSKHVEENRLYWGKDGGNTYPRLKKFISELEGGMVPVDLWTYKDTGTTDEGTKQLSDLFNAKIFDFPKPVGLVSKMMNLVTEPSTEDIILDFFGGSGTTAHGVIETNLKDEGNRRYIIVQMPESVAEGSEARKNNFSNIAQIARERIIRVSKGIKANKIKVDKGFLSYTLTPSHFKPWQNYHGQDPAELETLFSQFEDPLQEGWTEAGLTTEIMLTEGFPLDSRIEAEPAYGANRVRRVSSDFHAYSLLVCLDDKIAPDTIARLDLGSNDVFICLDRAITDQEKLRLSDKGLLKTI
ncbi:MAG: hypothetical protein KDD14_25575, partial [Saprospiraceae bacterium]|nr:hypothetical protein [Saprospiraceae bacterium]